MLLYNFTNLIKKYSSRFTAITLVCGYYNDSGDWVADGEERIGLEGAIISFKESKTYRSDGAYSAKDKRLFTLSPIDSKLCGMKVAYNGDLFSIESATENAKFTGVYAYTMKYVSAFKTKSPDHDLTHDVWRLEQRLDGVWKEREVPEPIEDITESAEDLEKRLDGVEVNADD